ncbi:unnamed protein product, partial [Linum tenue]
MIEGSVEQSWANLFGIAKANRLVYIPLEIVHEASANRVFTRGPWNLWMTCVFFASGLLASEGWCQTTNQHFFVDVEYCNRPRGCRKCRVFGHECEDIPEVVEEVAGNSVQDKEEAEVDPMLGEASLVGSSSRVLGLAKEVGTSGMLEGACRNLDRAVANLVSSLEPRQDPSTSSWGPLQFVSDPIVQLPSDKEFQNVIV